MKITIITVAYNSGRTIADTLQSVRAQTHPLIEHIVIDGASADDTLEVVKRHGPHVARCVSEADRGIYDAMNKGLALATGEIVGFLNADDVLEGRDAIAHIARAARSHDLVYGDLVYVREDDLGKVIRSWRSGLYRRSRLGFGWMPPHPTFYARRSLLRQVGGFDTGMSIAADYELMLRCLSRPSVSVGYVPRVLVRMRAGGASNATLRSMLKKSREDLGAMRRHGVGGWFTLAAKNLRKLPQFLPVAAE